MRNPVRVVRAKYRQHRTKIVAATSFAAGVGVAIYCIERKTPLPMEVETIQTASEIADMIQRAKAIDVTNPVTNHVISIFASDYAPEA